MQSLSRPLSLDIETRCGVETCTDNSCKHALDHHRSVITCAGLYWEVGGKAYQEVYRDLDRLRDRLIDLSDFVLVGHNLLQFDIKHLKAKGLDLTDRSWECTQLMAAALSQKIPDDWLASYELKRKELNKALPHGHTAHREAGKHSLKTLAPYFLGVKPFWENTLDKDNDDYVLTDCRHTFNLFKFLSQALVKDQTDGFYREKMKPWCRMFFDGEWEGVRLSFETMAAHEEKAKKQADEAKAKLDEMWKPAYDAYKSHQQDLLWVDYKCKAEAACDRLKDKTPDRVERTVQRYTALRYKAEAKIEPFNLDSPAQMAWLLRDYLEYDITNFEGEESTGVEVLERLAAEGKEDVKQLLEYREGNKLITSFFPTYRELAYQGKIHASFALARTRTGRSASSSPNLQQVPGHIRDIFVGDFIIKDYSGIEPVVIAYYSQCPILCDLLINKGGNFHSFNTPAFFPYVECSMEDVKKLYPKERDAAKELGLLLLYGGGWRRIKISMMKRGFKVSDRECKERYENFKDLYQTVFEFKLKTLDPMLSAGEPVTNLLGRKIRIARDDVHMKGLNTLVQSSASDLLLQSSLKIKRAGVAFPLLWIHDELVARGEPRAEAEIERIMTSYKLPTPYGNLPLKVEGHVAKYWKK